MGSSRLPIFQTFFFGASSVGFVSGKYRSSRRATSGSAAISARRASSASATSAWRRWASASLSWAVSMSPAAFRARFSALRALRNHWSRFFWAERLRVEGDLHGLAGLEVGDRDRRHPGLHVADAALQELAHAFVAGRLLAGGEIALEQAHLLLESGHPLLQRLAHAHPALVVGRGLLLLRVVRLDGGEECPVVGVGEAVVAGLRRSALGVRPRCVHREIAARVGERSGGRAHVVVSVEGVDVAARPEDREQDRRGSLAGLVAQPQLTIAALHGDPAQPSPDRVGLQVLGQGEGRGRRLPAARQRRDPGRLRPDAEEQPQAVGGVARAPAREQQRHVLGRALHDLLDPRAGPLRIEDAGGPLEFREVQHRAALTADTPDNSGRCADRSRCA